MSDRLKPHFVQIGDTPVIIGTGTDSIACACGGPVLVRGHRPGSLLGIDIECAACGEITSTPALPGDAAPPPHVQLVPRHKRPVPTAITLAAGTVLGDQDDMQALDARSRPRPPPTAPFMMSAATLADLADAYDRMTGGRLAADRAAVRAGGMDLSGRLPAQPLAWAFEQVEPNIDQSGWWCLAKVPDTVAAMHLAAFHQFSAIWSGHPLFPAMAASVAAGGFSLHALAVFAAAQCLAAAGNRVHVAPPPAGMPRIDHFHIDNAPTDLLPVITRPLDRFDWPASQSVTQAMVRAAATDTLIAAQGRVNARQHGMLVLSVGSVERHIDPAIIVGLAQTLDERWRKQRGLVGVALLLPNITATTRSDQVLFGWTFLPQANPRYLGTMVQAPPNPEGTPAGLPPGVRLQ